MKKFACATAVLGLMLVTNISMAGTKPLVGLPDYNGTYYGTPNTGSLYDSATNRFTVLYRDNYERETAGCAGEGCGKHPGIDIRIPSGTAVKASFGGTVIKSECNATWGGLIIIEADNPYIAGEKVYISYAHLRDRSVFLNDVVTEGQVIGESGGEDGLDQNGIPNGKTPDTCFGSSTGAHLHFQVDRPHGDTYPWYPSGTTNSIP
ncbi:M23 family metallopeptidase, partial [Patescibacteria group bacterium]|nr:M23 family metallopeptidase [Patescibacteria group bacterium]